jgi:Amiloride-sensitive sodium channel
LFLYFFRPTRYVFLLITVKKDNFFALRRSEIYGSIDLISQFGGLLGLFMGISLLSIVEILHFCTLRLICTFKIGGQHGEGHTKQHKPSPGKLTLQLAKVKKPCIEYSAFSSIHGFPYLVERDRSTIEKYFWAILIVISIYGCGLLISDLHTKWNDTPVIISLSEKATPIWQIPFPAITICPEDKTDSNVFNIRKNAQHFSRIGVQFSYDQIEDGVL